MDNEAFNDAGTAQTDAPDVAVETQPAAVETHKTADQAPKQAEPAPQPAPQPRPGFVTAVWYDYVANDGSKGTARLFVEGIPTLRERAQLENIERHIVATNERILSALITSWASLEA
jgi:hypothetical protein